MSDNRSIRITVLAAAVLAAVLSLSAACSLAYADDALWQGEGTKEEPYLIGSYEELAALSTAVKAGDDVSVAYFRLTSDIQLESGFEPVGALAEGEKSAASGRNIRPFSGELDGDGHTVTSAAGGTALFGYVREAKIHDLCIAGEDIKGSGLIGKYVIDYGSDGSGAGVHVADITNVTIKSGTNIEGSGFLSGLASGQNTVKITNCRAEAGVVVGSGRNLSKVGTFGGEFNGTVTGCVSAATVYGVDYVGGIIGCKGQTMCDTTVRGCTFTGKVEASGKYAGGIAGAGYGGHMGYTFESAPNGIMLTVENCLSLGRITAADVAGGIVGYETTAQPWSESFVRANLFAGSISLTDGACSGAIVGAFRGMDKYSTVEDNYFAEDCGTGRGIGGVQYLDTSAAEHETELCEYYYDTSSGSVPVMEGLNDIYSGNVQIKDSKKGKGNPYYNRTDDPLGADADRLAMKVTKSGLADGSVVLLLNSAQGSLKNWMQGSRTPVMDEETDDPDDPVDPDDPDDPVDPVDPDDPEGGDTDEAALIEAYRKASAALMQVEKYADKSALYTEESYTALSDARSALIVKMTASSPKPSDIAEAAELLKKAAAELVEADVPSEEEKEAEARKQAARSAAELLRDVEKYEEQEALYTPESYQAFIDAEDAVLALMTDPGAKAADIRDAAYALAGAALKLVPREANPMTIKAGTKTYKASGSGSSEISLTKTYKATALKKSARSFTACAVKKNEGAVTYTAAGNARSRKALKFSGKTGKLTVKKGLKKGTYKLTIKISAAGTDAYLPCAGTVAVTVIVK